MRIMTNIKAGGVRLMNHNQTIARGLKVKTNVKGGKLALNHSQTMAGEGKGLRVKTNVRAGKLAVNHNKTIMRDTA